MAVTPEKIARLRWQCRRGMLELDLLLLPFVENQYSNLTLDEQQTFEELLTYTDQELYHWLIGHEPAPDATLQKMLHKVLHYAQTKPNA